MFKKTLSFILLFGLIFSPILSTNVFADFDKSYRILIEEGNFEILAKNSDNPAEDIVRQINKKSALYAVYKADQTDNDWNITELIYYPAWNALYLKCVKYLETDYCDGWNFKVNGVVPDVGLDSYILLPQDKIEFYFQPWGDSKVYVTFEIEVYQNKGRRAVKEVVIEEPQKIEFDLEKGINFLIQNIKKGDEYLGSMYVDWGIIGLASKDKELALQFLDFYKKNNEIDEYLTENIRKSMTLLSLGQNPYKFEGKNYIAKILENFDGEQFGDKNLVNDDIFALIVLQNVGFDFSDEIIQQTIYFILKSQFENGSMSNNVDMTSAFIQAVKKFEFENEKVKKALKDAREFLENSQGQNGSWNDSLFSTAWVLQTLSLFDENVEVKYSNAFDFVARAQQQDGGLFNQNEITQNRFWVTAYTIPAILKKGWGEIMTSVTKEEVIKEQEKNEIEITLESENKLKEVSSEILGEETFKFTQFMKFGTKGGEVSELQKRLTKEGFFTGPITGYFGALTKEAVKKYQEANPPLKVDGIVGPKTRAVLNGTN